jgi:hypothetical protein
LYNAVLINNDNNNVVTCGPVPGLGVRCDCSELNGMGFNDVLLPAFQLFAGFVGDLSGHWPTGEDLYIDKVLYIVVSILLKAFPADLVALVSLPDPRINLGGF